eukprot:6403202-Amphidinium_carterae.1
MMSMMTEPAFDTGPQPLYNFQDNVMLLSTFQERCLAWVLIACFLNWFKLWSEQPKASLRSCLSKFARWCAITHNMLPYAGMDIARSLLVPVFDFASTVWGFRLLGRGQDIHLHALGT